MIDAATCRLCIDEPNPLFASQGGIQFSGWCFDEASTTVPRIRLIAGDRTCYFETGRPRPDVAAAFPQFPQAAVSGFLLKSWMPSGYRVAHLELSTDGIEWRRINLLFGLDDERTGKGREPPRAEIL